MQHALNSISVEAAKLHFCMSGQVSAGRCVRQPPPQHRRNQCIPEKTSNLQPSLPLSPRPHSGSQPHATAFGVSTKIGYKLCSSNVQSNGGHLCDFLATAPAVVLSQRRCSDQIALIPPFFSLAQHLENLRAQAAAHASA